MIIIVDVSKNKVDTELEFTVTRTNRCCLSKAAPRCIDLLTDKYKHLIKSSGSDSDGKL